MSVKLSILIPAYNEARTIHLILDKVKDVVLANNIIKEIIIVDDFSSDNTIVKIKEYQSENPAINISLFTQEKNKGKGAAIHKAISEATGDYLIVQDADLEYDPEEYNLLLKLSIHKSPETKFGCV